MVFDSKNDLRFDKNLKALRKELDHNRGEFIFDPDSLRGEAADYTVEAYRMPEEELLQYAKLATKLRQQFQEKAEAANLALQNSRIDELEPENFVEAKLYRGTTK